MIYGYEQPVQYTPVKVFNPVTANMVLQSMGQYADAVQREYERALQDEKEFFKEYGNFNSPVSGATEEYYKLGVGRVKDTIAAAQARGIDLTRSQEGRAILRNLINSADVGRMNQLKQQKEDYTRYMNTLQESVAKGIITPEQAAQKMRWDGVDKFTAIGENGVNNFYANAMVGPFENEDQYIDRVFGKIADTYLGTEGAFDMNGVGTQKLASVLAQSLPQYLNTDGGRYAFEKYYERATGKQINSKAEYDAAIADENTYNAFANEIMQGAVGKYARENRKVNPLKELEEEYRLKDLYDQKQSAREWQKAINVYKATHPNEFDKDGKPIPPAPTVDSQSYVRDVYNAAVGKVFGVDGYTASHMIEGEDGYTNAGQNIFKREESILRDYKCDVDKCISAHTSTGNLQSNIKMLDVPMGGSTKGSGNSKTTLNQNQFLRQNTKKKIYDASQIIFNTAGYYKKDKPRTKEQDDNYKDLNNATYFTVTNEVVGHLHKGGRFILYVKVIGDNGSVGYIPMSVYSNKKEGGHSYSAKNKSHDQDLGYDTQIEGSIKQRDLQATNVYTKEGSATNNGALEREAQN